MPKAPVKVYCIIWKVFYVAENAAIHSTKVALKSQHPYRPWIIFFFMKIASTLSSVVTLSSLTRSSVRASCSFFSNKINHQLACLRIFVLSGSVVRFLLRIYCRFCLSKKTSFQFKFRSSMKKQKQWILTKASNSRKLISQENHNCR